MWSYRKLVAAFGEDAALVLLEEQQGYGEFDPKISHWEYGQDTPCNDVHDEIPIKYPMTPLWYLTDEVGVVLSAWRKTNSKELSQENILSILRQM